jgi:hypothetical protein
MYQPMVSMMLSFIGPFNLKSRILPGQVSMHDSLYKERVAEFSITCRITKIDARDTLNREKVTWFRV